MGNIYIFRGKAGTGKTTLSNRLSQTLSVPVFRKDDIVEALKTTENVDKSLISNAVCYNILCKQIQTNIDLKTDFVIDIAMGHRGTAEAFFNMLDFKDSTVFYFLMDCSDEDIWQERHMERLKNPAPSQSFQSVEHLLAHYAQWDLTPFEFEHVIDSANTADSCFKQIMSIIGR